MSVCARNLFVAGFWGLGKNVEKKRPVSLLYGYGFDLLISYLLFRGAVHVHKGQKEKGIGKAELKKACLLACDRVLSAIDPDFSFLIGDFLHNHNIKPNLLIQRRKLQTPHHLPEPIPQSIPP